MKSTDGGLEARKGFAHLNKSRVSFLHLLKVLFDGLGILRACLAAGRHDNYYLCADCKEVGVTMAGRGGGPFICHAEGVRG